MGTHSVLRAQSALYRALVDASDQDMSVLPKSENEDQVKNGA
jgi:hypothetical protein